MATILKYEKAVVANEGHIRLLEDLKCLTPAEFLKSY